LKYNIFSTDKEKHLKERIPLVFFFLIWVFIKETFVYKEGEEKKKKEKKAMIRYCLEVCDY